MMSPNQDMYVRIFALQVAHIPKAKQILKSVFHSSLEVMDTKVILDTADISKYLSVLSAFVSYTCYFVVANLALKFKKYVNE